MKFGVCAPVENADLLKVAGWDFVEEHIQNYLEPLKSDEDWRGLSRKRACTLPAPIANSLIPPAIKITGPTADLPALKSYMTTTLRRAQAVGIDTLVFGSGAARTVPPNFDRAAARQQILDFLKMSVEIAERHRVILVAEHLNKGECNIINTVAEAMDYVKTINHPNLQCLADSYHLWLESEPLANVAAAMPWMRHVHISEKSRRAPSQSAEGKEQYRKFFRVLKDAGYDRTICVEALWLPEMKAHGQAANVLAFVKEQWAAA